MSLLPTRYFSEDELRPHVEKDPDVPDALIDPEHLDRLQELADGLRAHGTVTLSPEQFGRTEVALFVSILDMFGAIRINRGDGAVAISSFGHFATDFPYLLVLAMRVRMPIFEDWTRRSRSVPDRIFALEFLHHMELQRIEFCRRRGVIPPLLHEIPVAYAIIKARSTRRRRDVYLLELNKDWNRFNLIGGKQAASDGGEPMRTVLREMEEELGITREQVRLTALTSAPIRGYSLTGGKGTLAFYPCTLYAARIIGQMRVRNKDWWLTEDEIRSLADGEEPGLLINTAYLDFLFHKIPGGLGLLGYSIDHDVEPAWWMRWRSMIVSHKEWIIPALAILAGLMAFLRGCIQ